MKARNVYSFDPAFAKPNFGLTLSAGFRVSGAGRIDSRQGPRIASREARRAEWRARGFSQVQGDRSARRTASRTWQEH